MFIEEDLDPIENERTVLLNVIKSKGNCFTDVDTTICHSLCPIDSFCSHEANMYGNPKHNVDEAIRVGLERCIITEEDVFDEVL